MPEGQPSRLRPIDEPPCPECRTGILERAGLGPDLRALGHDVFQCNTCDHIDIATKAEGKSYGQIHPPGEPGPAPEAPRGSARRVHPQGNTETARGGGGQGSRPLEAARMNHRGVDFTLAADPEPNVWRWSSGSATRLRPAKPRQRCAASPHAVPRLRSTRPSASQRGIVSKGFSRRPPAMARLVSLFLEYRCA